VNKSLVPPLVDGFVSMVVKEGAYTVTEVLAVVLLADGSEYPLKLAQKCPIRIPRPTNKRYPATIPLVTGQRFL
ncbi:V-type ATP synthase subunit A, partial [Blautia producta]|nr:V-type ATP synthase subunit A [Blautia producta]